MSIANGSSNRHITQERWHLHFLLFPVLSYLGSRDIGWSCPHTGQVILPQLLSYLSILFTNALTEECLINLLGVSQINQVDN
jgi:hypothetical protein